MRASRPLAGPGRRCPPPGHRARSGARRPRAERGLSSGPPPARRQGPRAGLLLLAGLAAGAVAAGLAAADPGGGSHFSLRRRIRPCAGAGCTPTLEVEVWLPPAGGRPFGHKILLREGEPVGHDGDTLWVPAADIELELSAPLDMLVEIALVHRGQVRNAYEDAFVQAHCAGPSRELFSERECAGQACCFEADACTVRWFAHNATRHEVYSMAPPAFFFTVAVQARQRGISYAAGDLILAPAAGPGSGPLAMDWLERTTRGPAGDGPPRAPGLRVAADGDEIPSRIFDEGSVLLLSDRAAEGTVVPASLIGPGANRINMTKSAFDACVACNKTVGDCTKTSALSASDQLSHPAARKPTEALAAAGLTCSLLSSDLEALEGDLSLGLSDLPAAAAALPMLQYRCEYTKTLKATLELPVSPEHFRLYEEVNPVQFLHSIFIPAEWNPAGRAGTFRMQLRNAGTGPYHVTSVVRECCLEGEARPCTSISAAGPAVVDIPPAATVELATEIMGGAWFGGERGACHFELRSSSHYATIHVTEPFEVVNNLPPPPTLPPPPLPPPVLAAPPPPIDGEGGAPPAPPVPPARPLLPPREAVAAPPPEPTNATGTSHGATAESGDVAARPAGLAELRSPLDDSSAAIGTASKADPPEEEANASAAPPPCLLGAPRCGEHGSATGCDCECADGWATSHVNQDPMASVYCNVPVELQAASRARVAMNATAAVATDAQPPEASEARSWMPLDVDDVSLEQWAFAALGLLVLLLASCLLYKRRRLNQELNLKQENARRGMSLQVEHPNIVTHMPTHIPEVFRDMDVPQAPAGHVSLSGAAGARRNTVKAIAEIMRRPTLYNFFARQGRSNPAPGRSGVGVPARV